MAKLTIKELKSHLRNLGLTHSKIEDEHRVNYIGGHEKTAYYTNDIEDALNTGKAMAEHAAKRKQKIKAAVSDSDHLEARNRAKRLQNDHIWMLNYYDRCRLNPSDHTTTGDPASSQSNPQLPMGGGAAPGTVTGDPAPIINGVNTTLANKQAKFIAALTQFRKEI